MDVAYELSEVPICLAKDPFIPSLKQVANLPILSIVILAVSGQQGLHDLTDRIVLHLSQQMDVIRHQAVRVEIERTLRFLVLERKQKLKIVIVRSEYAPAIIPASDDVVEPTGYFNSRLASHGRVRIFPHCSNVNISCLTPA
jgi:hypothetical protein